MLCPCCCSRHLSFVARTAALQCAAYVNSIFLMPAGPLVEGIMQSEIDDSFQEQLLALHRKLNFLEKNEAAQFSAAYRSASAGPVVSSLCSAPPCCTGLAHKVTFLKQTWRPSPQQTAARPTAQRPARPELATFPLLKDSGEVNPPIAADKQRVNRSAHRRLVSACPITGGLWPLNLTSCKSPQHTRQCSAPV